MDKLGRNYILQVQTKENGPFLTIQPPFTIEFDITRKTLASAQCCQVRIYNLGPKNRDQIQYNVDNYGELRAIILNAGYGSNLPLIFSGNITEAWSVREGVNMITQIECYSGGFAFVNGYTNQSFPENTEYSTVAVSLIKDLPGVSLGAVGSLPGQLTRGNSYVGPTAKILDELTGGAFYIDQAKAYILGTNEYVANLNGTVEINAASGLLGTPVLEQSLLRFDMIFEPGLNVGQKIKLSALTNQTFNGDYKITAVKHRGMISAAVCGEVITTGEFSKFKVLEPVNGD